MILSYHSDKRKWFCLTFFSRPPYTKITKRHENAVIFISFEKIVTLFCLIYFQKGDNKNADNLYVSRN